MQMWHAELYKLLCCCAKPHKYILAVHSKFAFKQSWRSVTHCIAKALWYLLELVFAPYKANVALILCMRKHNVMHFLNCVLLRHVKEQLCQAAMICCCFYVRYAMHIQHRHAYIMSWILQLQEHCCAIRLPHSHQIQEAAWRP